MRSFWRRKIRIRQHQKKIGLLMTPIFQRKQTTSQVLPGAGIQRVTRVF